MIDIIIWKLSQVQLCATTNIYNIKVQKLFLKLNLNQHLVYLTGSLNNII